MKKGLIVLLVITLVFTLLATFNSKEKETIVIYSSAEEFRNEAMQKQLNAAFPQYRIVVEYLGTGTRAAKIAAEGKKTDVDIVVQVNLDGVCDIGGGHLTHNAEGFRLTSDDGALDYSQPADFTHTLYADYYWYEIADTIGIGNNEYSYFCFPKSEVSVTKARLATEEIYKIAKANRRRPRKEKTEE